jgi:membrane-bound lytic murein transglycosylase D
VTVRHVVALAAVVLAACASVPSADELALPPASLEHEPIEVPPIELTLDLSIDATLRTPPSPVAGFPLGVYEKDFDMPIQYHPRVQYFIDLFTGRFRDRFTVWLSRRGRFEEMITRELDARGMPDELSLLPLVESGYSVSALSRASAMGLWQFMAGTARLEGLEVSTYLDERRDPGLATIAALQHLQKLYDRYGSWYLSLAAYNSGGGRVDRALAAKNIAVPANDSAFWQIRDVLPQETRDYVPAFIASSVLAQYPDLFGLDEISVERPEPIDTVVVPDATDFAVIAEAAGITEAEVRRLNPQYVRGVTPNRRASPVRLPSGTAPAFQVAYAAVPPNKRVRVREHVVRNGETLSGIAKRYGTTVAAIQEANNIKRANRLRVGQRLRIPLAATRRSG